MNNRLNQNSARHYLDGVLRSSCIFGVLAFWLAVLDWFPAHDFSSISSSIAHAQEEAQETDGLILKKKGVDLLGGLGSKFGAQSKNPFRFSATYTLATDQLSGVVEVVCKLDPDYYIYSVTQPRGGPMRTNITVKSPTIKISEPFQSELPPLIVKGEPGFEQVQVETHIDKVVWRTDFVSTSPLDPATDQIALSLNGQVCRKGACIPIQNQAILAVSESVVANRNSLEPEFAEDSKYENPDSSESPSGEGGGILEMAGSAPPSPTLGADLPMVNGELSNVNSVIDGMFKADKSRVRWRIDLSPSKVVSGARAELILTAVTEPPFHLYEVRPSDANYESSTTIAITQKSGLQMGLPVPTEPPTKKDLIAGQLSVAYHGEQIAWRIPIEIRPDLPDGSYLIEGKIGYQACTDLQCEDPLGLKFTGSLDVARNSDLVSESASTFLLESISYREATSDPARLTWVDVFTDQTAISSPAVSEIPDAEAGKPIQLGALFGYFALAMAGGLVLNLMPCVLPVIGLKIMSFVQESKQSKASVSILNLWYVAGILSVFMLLASVTIVAREVFGTTFGWGDQFGYFGFRLATTILMFAMALSFLGVWEIPIPGFATSQHSSQLMRREGATGAYFKGLLTTVLATPCSGPGLGAVFSLSIDQAPWVILLMYFAIGLGMSLPYILIAINPGLLAWMPKPGEWMQTLKEILAFPLLLSVVWFLTTFSDEYRIAVFTCLIAVWLACWWIGKVPPWTESNVKFFHWSGALAVGVAGCFLAIQYLGPYKNLIDWQPYDESKLVLYRSQGKAVIIDFTAQWCANCKFNLATAIETEKVAKLIRQQGIVPMIADHTDLPDHITRKLDELRSSAIPVLAVYPAGASNPPIVMRDLLTEKQVIAALRQATRTDQSEGLRVPHPVSTLSDTDTQ